MKVEIEAQYLNELLHCAAVEQDIMEGYLSYVLTTDDEPAKENARKVLFNIDEAMLAAEVVLKEAGYYNDKKEPKT
jgi:hypothetical protein